MQAMLPYAGDCVTYTDDATNAGVSWSLFLETMQLFFSLLAINLGKRTILADNYDHIM